MPLHFPSRLRFAGGLASLLAIAVLGASALAGTASLDPTFSDDGKRELGHSVADVVIQPDGRIVVVGPASPDGADAFVVTRLRPDGSLDRTLDGDGTRLIDFGNDDWDSASAVALQPDGRIVVVGYSSETVEGTVEGRAAIARLNPDGSLDSSFDGDGKATIERGYDVGLRDVLIQPDGRIVVAGRAGSGPSYPGMLVARLNPNGSFDSSFGEGGRSVIPFSAPPPFTGGALESPANAAALQGDGRIVVAGSAWYGGLGQGTDVVAARLDPDGSLDSSFGDGGRLTIDDHPGRDNRAEEVLVQPDGKIVLVGDGGQTRPTVWRLNSEGSFDRSFGEDGVVRVQFGRSDHGKAAALQPDGRIVVAGYGVAPDGEGFGAALARLNANGKLDPSFDGDGKRMISFNGRSGPASAIALQGNGRIVLGGDAYVARVRVGQARCRGTRATLIGTPGPDLLTGTRGRDVIVARGGKDLVRGLGGDDLVCGGTGDDKLLGQGGSDRLHGDRGRDRLYGGRGEDTLRGGRGVDALGGGPGTDELIQG